MTEQMGREAGGAGREGARMLRHPLLPAAVCAAVQGGGAGWNPVLETTVRAGTASGRACCRACGQPIARGAPVYALWYALSAAAQVRPELLIKCYLHAQRCTVAG